MKVMSIDFINIFKLRLFNEIFIIISLSKIMRQLWIL